MRHQTVDILGISNIEMPNTILAKNLTSGMRITILGISGNDSFISTATVSQTFLSEDGKHIRVYCNIKTGNTLMIPIDNYVEIIN